MLLFSFAPDTEQKKYSTIHLSAVQSLFTYKREEGMGGGGGREEEEEEGTLLAACRDVLQGPRNLECLPSVHPTDGKSCWEAADPEQSRRAETGKRARCGGGDWKRVRKRILRNQLFLSLLCFWESHTFFYITNVVFTLWSSVLLQNNNVGWQHVRGLIWHAQSLNK